MLKEYLSDWEFILSLFPEGWIPKLKELGMLRFGRKFAGELGASNLMRVLFMHLGCGMSLRTTSAAAKQSNIADISDVALLKRLRKSEAWFQWGTENILNRLHSDYQLPLLPSCGRIRAVDATIVREEGVTGSQWRIHYCANLGNLHCEDIKITDLKTAESFVNFQVQPNDLMTGDRAYARAKSIGHVVANDGNVLCRFSPHLLPLYTPDGKRFQLLNKLRRLEYGELGEWYACIQNGEQKIKARVCACKRTPADTLKEQDDLRKQGIKKCYNPSDKAMEYAGYVLIITTLAPEEANVQSVFMIYRLRWQIELIFKRLKSILELGQLHKYDKDCVRASLAGKLFIALLLELIVHTGDSFFPWGNMSKPLSKSLA